METLDVFPIQRRMVAIPLPQMSLRSRREVSALDQINSLHVEQWQTDAPQLQNDRPDPHNTRSFMDMNPINTRTTDRNYLQNQPYVADDHQLGQNPYFERFDVVTDPFNVARELRATVYEDKVDRGLLESKRLLNRTYTTRYKAPDYAEKNSLDSLNSYEDLRPRLNTMEKTYRPYKN